MKPDEYRSGFPVYMEIPCLSWGLTLASGVAGWAGTGMALLGLGCAAAGWSGRAHISHVVWGPRAVGAFELHSMRGEG